MNNLHSRAWEWIASKRRCIPLGRGRSTLADHFRQQGPEVGQTERLVEVGPVQAFEEGQSVAPNGVPGAEDETRRHARVTASQLLVELPSPKAGHPEIRNDEIELLAGRS